MGAEDGTALQVRLLGALHATRAGRVLELGPPRQRAVLAMLALGANRVVTRDELVDGVWGSDPPASVVNRLHVLVGALRRELEPERLPRAPGRILASAGSGYTLAVAPGQCDVDEFAAHLRRAATCRADGDATGAVRALDAALELWRGTPLAGLPGPFADIQRARLSELRVSAAEARAEALLELGDVPAATAELYGLVAVNPLRERLRSLLITALCRGGRRAEALALFAETRALLLEELGVEPGAELQRLHREILTYGTDLPGRRIESSDRGYTPPRQLPLAASHFAGRAAELAALDRWARGVAGASTAVISAIGGTAGIGKTTLAVHWAHRVAARFPDGQLYVNLRGFDPTTPVSTAEALRGFLEAFHTPPERIPAGLDAQAALYRSLVADKRVLVVLDNAATPEQVRPLLPGSATCRVLVTSRDRLAGLVAIEGVYPLTLDLLPDFEARDQLCHHLGAPRVTAEPRAVDDIVSWCAGLPLALAIIAARAATSPGQPLAVLADELRTAHGRLDPFDAGEPSANVRVAFSWSYDQLGATAARLFRLLGLHPGPDFAAPAAASLAGLPPQRIQPALAELSRVHLVSEQRPGRFGCHDLLRAYAVELAHRHDGPLERRAAVHRILDHYTHTAHAASALLNPHRAATSLPVRRSGVTPESLPDQHQAMQWFTSERVILMVAMDQAVGAGFDAHLRSLAWALAIFFQRRGHWRDWAATQRAAVAAARRHGDLSGQAHAHRDLARAYTAMGRFGAAHTHLLHALDLFRSLDDAAGQGHTHLNLGILFDRQGHHEQSLGHAQQALTFASAAGHRVMQARALNAVGWLHAQLGRHRDALAYCDRALCLLQELGDRYGEAATWDSLGFAHHHLGDHGEAVRCQLAALTLRRQLGDRTGEAIVLTHLGDTHHAAGAIRNARLAWQQALVILDQIDSPGAAPVRAKLAAVPVASGPGRVPC